MVLLIIAYLGSFQNHLLHLELLERPVCVLHKSHPCTYSVLYLHYSKHSQSAVWILNFVTYLCHRFFPAFVFSCWLLGFFFFFSVKWLIQATWPYLMKVDNYSESQFCDKDDVCNYPLIKYEICVITTYVAKAFNKQQLRIIIVCAVIPVQLRCMGF